MTNLETQPVEVSGLLLPKPATELGAVRRIRSVVGLVIVVALWALIALVLPGHWHVVVPSPFSVARQLWDDRSFYPAPLGATLKEAGIGYLIGNVLGVCFALFVVLWRAAEKPALRIAIASYCMPIIAIGPILKIVLTGTWPQITLAALSVFFTTVIGTLVGLHSADPTSLRLIRAYGGGKLAELQKVRIRAALPNLFAALKIAGPAAILGAMIGEFLGADQGIGVVLVTSEQALNVARTWGIAIVVTVVAGLAYAITGLIGHLLTSWASERTGMT
jgi:ABC-type nitrate/sulfonate/bicarbonate transport system permease component